MADAARFRLETAEPSPLRLSVAIHACTEHVKVYILAGTLVAVGLDVAGRAMGAAGGAMAGVVAGAMAAMPGGAHQGQVPSVFVWGIHATGALIVAVGAILYATNVWVGYTALRDLRFRFAERGPLLRTCGWSLAFAYVLVSAVIGIAVNAVYLALVG